MYASRTRGAQGSGALVRLRGSLQFSGLKGALLMKLMRFALFFAAGTYLGFNAESMGDWETIAQTIRDLVERFRDLR